MTQAKEPIRLIACGIFKAEYSLLPESLRLQFSPFFLDSMLHMNPEKLDAILSGILQANEGRQTVLAFGDCCPHIDDYCTRYGAVRVKSLNCSEIYLGRQRYKELEKKGTFFLMPEWAARWHEIIKGELGLHQPELARDFMAQTLTEAVYVDTGCLPVPQKTLEEFSDFTGLPLSVEKPGSEFFQAALEEALAELAANKKAAYAETGDRIGSFNFLLSELVSGLLQSGDSPGHSADYLAETLRSLIGAKTVLVLVCTQYSKSGKHDLLSVFPHRRKEIASYEAVQDLAMLSHEVKNTTLFDPSDNSPISSILTRLGVGPSIICPLRYSKERVGVLFLLGLMDTRNIGTILDTLDRVAAVLALVIRNSFLYNNLETEVARRTAELEDRTALLTAALRQKETMLKEVHHRVKNNLQIINSLLSLQAVSTSEPLLREALRKGQSRIHSMSLVHEELYQSKDLTSISLDSYVKNLCHNLGELLDDRISLSLNVEKIKLSIIQAVPCGLILNELITNSLKYAYPGKQNGEVRITIEEIGSTIVMSVEDDGIGFSYGKTGDKPAGLGLTLIQGLTDQLSGSLRFVSKSDGKSGARFEIEFPHEGIL